MHRRLLVFVTMAATAIYLGQSRADAQTSGQAQPVAAPFNPSMGDLMNTLVQPRHAKLGLIGREQNWTLAAYEIHQLKDALLHIGQWRPRFRNMSVPDLMAASTGEPIKAIEQAIQASDARQFTEAFGRLTEGCNNCHAALNHGYIVIQVPDQSYFANQRFHPPK